MEAYLAVFNVSSLSLDYPTSFGCWKTEDPDLAYTAGLGFATVGANNGHNGTSGEVSTQSCNSMFSRPTKVGFLQESRRCSWLCRPQHAYWSRCRERNYHPVLWRSLQEILLPRMLNRRSPGIKGCPKLPWWFWWCGRRCTSAQFRLPDFLERIVLQEWVIFGLFTYTWLLYWNLTTKYHG